MQHPIHLHARAAIWSLHLARTTLASYVHREAATDDDGVLAAAPTLRSPLWGTRHVLGDHGDPVGTVVLVAEPQEAATWADLDRRLTGRLTWLADQVGADPGPDPLARLQTALPRLQPGTVAVIVRHLQDEDRWVRAALRLDPPGELLAGTECPVCGARPLRLLPTGRHHGVVVCGARCRCAGQGCRCRMPVVVEGAAHVWATVAAATAA